MASQNNIALIKALEPVDLLQRANAAEALRQFRQGIERAQEVQDRVPSTPQELEDNSSRANELSKMHADLEARRKEMKRPFMDGGKMIDNLLCPTLDNIVTLRDKIRHHNKQYTDELERIRREEEEHARRIEEGRRKAQETREAKGMTVKPVEEIAPVARPVSVRSQVSVRMVRTYHFEIVNYKMVAEDWKRPGWELGTLDTVKIRSAQAAANKEAEEAAKKGEAAPPCDIPGLKLWTEDTPY